MVVVLLKFRLRADIDLAEWEQTFVRMVGLASEMSVFISIDTYGAEDEAGLAVARFESEEDVHAMIVVASPHTISASAGNTTLS